MKISRELKKLFWDECGKNSDKFNSGGG